MSGSRKHAKRAFGCPLDGRVGPQPDDEEGGAHLAMVAKQPRPASAMKLRGRRPLAADRTDSPACLESAMNSKALAPYLFGTPPTAARDQGIHFFGDKLTVSGPPTDGQPGCEGLVTRMSSTPRAAANLQAQEERTTARLDYSATRTSCLTNWGPTFDMSGGPKGAKRPLGRPLDGGVMRLHGFSGVFHKRSLPTPAYQKRNLALSLWKGSTNGSRGSWLSA